MRISPIVLGVVLICSWAVFGTPRVNAQARPDNERIVTEADGTKTVLVRWAIGSRDNIVTLRIPLDYLPMVGGDSRGEPFTGTTIFEAMLWDMHPNPRNRELPRSERNQLISGMMESIFDGTKPRTEVEQLNTRAKIRFQGVKRNAYQYKYHLEIAEKPDRFGLKRIGPIHSLGNQTPVGLYDYYYTGRDPETSSDFMQCSDEAVPDDPPPGRFENPGCQQWFALPELSATVKVSYRRRHLGEWREIKRLVTQQLLSWKASNDENRR